MSDASALLHKRAQRMPQHKEVLLTIAEQLKQEAWLEGWLEGKRESTRRVALSLLKMKMPREAIKQATGLTEDELNQIQTD